MATSASPSKGNIAVGVAAQMGLSNLQMEPQRLAIDAERLNNELECLVLENYKIFVENLTCSAGLRIESTKIHDTVSELGEALGALCQQSSAFHDRVNHFVDLHKRNRKTLQHHMQLVELLEVPQLVDACARNGFHDEALELAAFVNSLERRHLLAAEVRSLGHQSSNVVQSIVNDVYNSLLGLRQQLLVALTENLSLPKEMQLLSTLRRLDGLLIDRSLALERNNNPRVAALTDVQREALRKSLTGFSETRIQMDFLDGRTTWLRKLTEKALSSSSSAAATSSSFEDAVPDVANTAASGIDIQPTPLTLSPYARAIELLEVSRTSWFAVVMQFNALFRELPQQPQGVVTSSPPDTTTAAPFPAHSVIGAWVTHHIHSLLWELKSILPAVEEGTALRTILEQTLFFAARMGAVGADFTPLALPVFTEALIARARKDFSSASSNFKKMILHERYTVETFEGISKEQVVPLYVNQEGSSDDASSSKTPHAKSASVKQAITAEEIAAPSSVMSFPPLAYLLNDFLGFLNFLREYPLRPAEEAIHVEMGAVMLDVTACLITHAKTIRDRGDQYKIALINHPHHPKPPSAGSNVSKSATQSSETRLDQLYCDVFARDVLPHIFLSFDLIFPSVGTKRTKKEELKRLYFRADSLAKLQPLMRRESFSIITDAWNTFKKENLVADTHQASDSTAPHDPSAPQKSVAFSVPTLSDTIAKMEPHS